MTKVEVKKVLKLLLTADNGCPACTSNLFKQFVKQFPKLEVEAIKVWKEENGDWSDFRDPQ